MEIMKRFRVGATIILLLSIAIVVSMHFYNQGKIRQEFLEKEIYEVGDTFTYVERDNSLFAFYMICEPPSEHDELVRVVLAFIEENDIIQQLRDRMPYRVVNTIYLSFVEPSKSFPIGWNDGEATGFLGTERLVDHRLITVYIPMEAQSQREYLIIVSGDGLPEALTPEEIDEILA